MVADPTALDAAIYVVNTIAARHRKGKLRSGQDSLEAISAVIKCIALLEALANESSRMNATARAHQLLGDLYMDMARLDDAIDEFEEAIEWYERAGGDSEDYGTFLHNLSLTLHNLNVEKLPLQYAQRSRAILARYGNSYVKRLDALIMRLKQMDDPAVQIETLRREVKRQRRGIRRAEAAHNLAVTLSRREDARQFASEIFDALEYTFDVVAKRGLIEDACNALSTVLNLYWLDIPLPGWVGRASNLMIAEAQRINRTDLLRDSLTVLAGWLHQQGHEEESLEIALRAISRHDEHMLATESSTFRMLVGHVGQFAREIALRSAIRSGNAELAAELVETSRLQVTPDGRDDSASAPDRSRVANLRTISVGGRSRLAPYYGANVVIGELALESAVISVGGPGAIWWGAWVANGVIYWALWLDGRWSCGLTNAEPNTVAGDLIHQALEVSLHNPDATTGDIIRGEWCRTVHSEEMFSVELGEAVIPADLIASLLDASSDSPRSLVLSGNFFRDVPMPLLGMRRGLLDTPVRVVEAAVLRVAPPAVLVEVVERRPFSLDPSDAVLVACVDPTGNLPHSGAVPPSLVKLSGSPMSGFARPTLQNLSDSLSSISPGDPGLFYYSGHTVENGRGGDDEDGLALSDGDVLSARLLFSHEGTRFPLPARSMISACQSAGAGGAGAGEWLGLSAALLWRGSRQVVGTNWKIWDTSFTSRFDLDLVDRLRATGDSARALRDAQVAALNQWRNSQHNFSSHQVPDGLPWQAGEMALPLIWAAYCSVGTLR